MLSAMPMTAHERHGTSAYAGLDFIKAAFCPLDFNARPLTAHPNYTQLGNDKALAELEVSDPLHYARQFPYTDGSGNRKTGTQIVTAHFGLAPKDFDLFLGIYTYLKRLPEVPVDGRSFLTIDFLARQLNLPADGQASYQRHPQPDLPVLLCKVHEHGVLESGGKGVRYCEFWILESCGHVAVD